MSVPAIPFNRPCLAGRELEYLAHAVQLGHSSGDGSYSRHCHEFLEREVGVERAFLTSSCTDALEMCALLLRLEAGDEVIVPSFTFVSTANAFLLHGARPVFIDVRPDTLNIDERLLEPVLAACRRPRAVVAVHYAGVGCEMEELGRITARRGLVLVEDNAHGLFGRYRGRPLGSFGALATLSFHETKNFTCGEGGALLVNDAAFIERAEILRDKGTNRRNFLRGAVDKYTWVDLGSSFLLSDLLAAFLFAQLEARQEILAKRRRLWDAYRSALTGWAARNQFGLPCVPSDCEQSYHMFYLLAPSQEVRDGLINHLKARQILAVFHYQPLHNSPAGREYGFTPLRCSVTVSASRWSLAQPGTASCISRTTKPFLAKLKGRRSCGSRSFILFNAFCSS